MSKVMVNDESLYDIADSIRAKLGTETTYLLSEMADAIEGIETGTELTSEDEGKVVIEEDGDYVLSGQTSLSISNNGTYDTTTNNEVVVNVSGGGGGGITTLTRQEWNALTDAQKGEYEVVGIIDYLVGYERGVIVSGTDYLLMKSYLPESQPEVIRCLANYSNFENGSSAWGYGDSPVVVDATLGRYQSEDAVYFDAKSNNKNAHIPLVSTTSDFTMYVVAKGISYVSGDVIVMGSVNAWNNDNLIMLYHRSGTVWRTSIYGSDTDLTDTQGDYVAVAIRSSSMKASWFASDGSNRTNVAYNSHGADFTFGYRGTVFSSDLAVKFVGYVDEAETDAQISANLAKLAEIYNIS